MPELPASAVPEHRLSVAELLGFMVADGLVTKKDADALIAESRLRRQVLHPLVLIGEQKWKSLLPPHRPLQLDDVGEWFAARVGLEYYHIDPLKIDFTAVTDVMSSAYATRFGILPVQVNASEIVIATTEPFLRDWEDEIAGISRKRIRRVIASPSDVARYLVEFYNLARSVKKAAQLGGQSAGLSSFEQLVELGKTNRQFDANDQHIVNIVDWLWQYAFEQRASDIHIEPRRELDGCQVRLGLLALEARIGEAGVDQVVEFFEVHVHHLPEAFLLLALIGFGQHLQCEAHARDRRAQFVRNRARQFLLRCDQPLDTLGHSVQRFREQLEGTAACFR